MTIAEWLESPNPSYTVGLLLYKQYGNNPSLLSLFESGQNSFTRSKLREALGKVQSSAGVELKVVVQTKTREHAPEKPKDQSPIAHILSLKQVSFKEMAALHQQLALLKTDADRYNAALRIHELDVIVDQCWTTIDYFNEHGTLPPDDEDMSIKTIGDVVRLAKNVPTYISKLNAKLRDGKLSDEQASELEQKKAQWQVLLSKVEGLMNEPIHV